jgi:hypothetical protein
MIWYRAYKNGTELLSPRPGVSSQSKAIPAVRLFPFLARKYRMCVQDLGAMWLEDRLLLILSGAVHVRIHFAVLRIIIFAILARACSFAEAQKIVKRVVIHSSAGGLRGVLHTVVVIKRKGGKFLSNGRPVSAVQVQFLVDALSAAPMIVPDSKNLGITDEWLAAKTESLRPPNATASQKSFITLTLIGSVLPNLLTPDTKHSTISIFVR